MYRLARWLPPRQQSGKLVSAAATRALSNMSSGGGARQRRGRARNAAPAEDSLIEEKPDQVTPIASTADDAAAIVADNDDGAEPFDNSDLLLSSEEIRARLRSHDLGLDAGPDDSSDAPVTPQRGIPRDAAISSPGAGSQSQSVAAGTPPALSSFKAVAAAATRDWYIPWLILLVAGFTRYYRLDRPNSVAFGEQ